MDIWATGVSLYALMFGKLPFYGEEFVTKLRNEDP